MRSISRISERSMRHLHASHGKTAGHQHDWECPQPIVALTVSSRCADKLQLIGSHDRGRCRRLVAPRQGIEDHVRTVRPSLERLRACGLNRDESITQHRSEQVDHLAVAIPYGLELVVHAAERAWQLPTL